MKHSSAFLTLVKETMPRIREIGPEEVAARLLTSPPSLTLPLKGGREFILIDVREDNEWAAGHIEGATHMGRGVIERDIENAVPDKNTALVLYCGGGYRSALAADNLQKMGYTNVYSLADGWRGWVNRDLPRT